jgi:hypothetical protein
MARQASEFTKAIRQLCDETNFSITYSQAREKLVEMGFEVASEQPSEKSEQYRQWEGYALKRPKNPNKVPRWYKSTVKAAGLPANSVEEIIQEDSLHRPFLNERRKFDATKFYYQRIVGNEVSKKPQKTRKTRTTKSTKSISSENMALIKWLVEQGGANKVQQKIESLNAEISLLSNNLQKAKLVLEKISTTAA